MRKTIVCILVLFLAFCLADTAFSQDKAKPERSNGAKWSKTVILETNAGNIELKLFGDVAPKACENFVSLVRKGYYDGTMFHRVIKNFMIQGGDPTGTGRGGNSIWGKPFEDEFSKDVSFAAVGLLAMANAGPGTNGSQFFITTSVENTRHLTGRHTIFGKVIGGMDVVRKIENAGTDSMDRPLEKQYIIKAYIKGDK